MNGDNEKLYKTKDAQHPKVYGTDHQEQPDALGNHTADI
jgi:hypothetical protein